MEKEAVRGDRLDATTEVWTWKQTDGYYWCLAVSNDNGFFETDDNGPFETREEALESARESHIQDN